MTESDTSQQTTPAAVAIQLLLAEKRTSLSMVRTAIAVLALPLGLTGALIATSKLYDPNDVWHVLGAVAVIDVVLLGIGFRLLVQALLHLHREDRRLKNLRERHREFEELLD